ncbi:hypothetical protein [Streptococcus marmotae]|uniref:hypothetical protein n=1 Tax=Streptococcus marmotae TaxID=1825069 RepID=UPI000833D7B5|nr:hypothetical protein [Streptococcus marmotae]
METKEFRKIVNALKKRSLPESYKPELLASYKAGRLSRQDMFEHLASQLDRDKYWYVGGNTFLFLSVPERIAILTDILGNDSVPLLMEKVEYSFRDWDDEEEKVQVVWDDEEQAQAMWDILHQDCSGLSERKTEKLRKWFEYEMYFNVFEFLVERFVSLWPRYPFVMAEMFKERFWQNRDYSEQEALLQCVGIFSPSPSLSTRKKKRLIKDFVTFTVEEEEVTKEVMRARQAFEEELFQQILAQKKEFGKVTIDFYKTVPHSLVEDCVEYYSSLCWWLEFSEVSPGMYRCAFSLSWNEPIHIESHLKNESELVFYNTVLDQMILAPYPEKQRRHWQQLFQADRQNIDRIFKEILIYLYQGGGLYDLVYSFSKTLEPVFKLLILKQIRGIIPSEIPLEDRLIIAYRESLYPVPEHENGEEGQPEGAGVETGEQLLERLKLQTLTAAKEKELVATLAPESLELYQEIRKRMDYVRQKCEQMSGSREEVLAQYEAKKQDFYHQLHAYLLICHRPYDYSDAQELMQQHHARLEVFSDDLQKWIRDLNEEELSDFEISMRMIFSSMEDEDD